MMGGPLGELEPYLQALDEAFERHGVVLAYLYGSQARGDAGPLSDVDVAVLFGPDMPESERFNRVLHLHGRTDLREFGQRIIEYLQRTDTLSTEV